MTTPFYMDRVCGLHDFTASRRVLYLEHEAREMHHLLHVKASRKDKLALQVPKAQVQMISLPQKGERGGESLLVKCRKNCCIDCDPDGNEGN